VNSERFQPTGAARSEVLVAMETSSCEDPHDGLGQMESQRLRQLAGIFPQYSESELLEILKQVEFSLDSAVAILQD
jgi:hypothetical protein